MITPPMMFDNSTSPSPAYDPLRVSAYTGGGFGTMPSAQFLTPAGYGSYRALPGANMSITPNMQPSLFGNMAIATGMPFTFNPAVNPMVYRANAARRAADTAATLGANVAGIGADFAIGSAIGTALGGSKLALGAGLGSTFLLPVGAIGTAFADRIREMRSIQMRSMAKITAGRDLDPVTGMGFSGAAAANIDRFIRKQGAGDFLFREGDYRNILNMGMEMGMFDYAGNAEQYKTQLKKLRNTFATAMSVLGSTDFKEILKDLKRLQDLGASTGQMGSLLRREEGFARMAGMRHDEMVATYGQAGAVMATTRGLSGITGSLASMGHAAAIRIAQQNGLVGPSRLAALGGESGYVTMATESSLRSEQNMEKLIAAIVSSNKGTQFDYGKMEDLLKRVNRGTVDLVREAGAAMRGMDATTMQNLEVNSGEFHKHFRDKLGEQGYRDFQLQTYFAVGSKVLAHNPSATQWDKLMAGYRAYNGADAREAAITLRQMTDPAIRAQEMRNERLEYMRRREEERARDTVWHRAGVGISRLITGISDATLGRATSWFGGATDTLAGKAVAIPDVTGTAVGASATASVLLPSNWGKNSSPYVAPQGIITTRPEKAGIPADYNNNPMNLGGNKRKFETPEDAILASYRQVSAYTTWTDKGRTPLYRRDKDNPTEYTYVNGEKQKLDRDTIEGIVYQWQSGKGDNPALTVSQIEKVFPGLSQQKVDPNTPAGKEAIAKMFQVMSWMESNWNIDYKTHLDIINGTFRADSSGRRAGSVADALNRAYRDYTKEKWNVTYKWSEKNIKSGAIDCSGWAIHSGEEVMDRINEMTGADIFDEEERKFFRNSAIPTAADSKYIKDNNLRIDYYGGAAGMLSHLGKRYGGEIEFSSSNYDHIREGMVVFSQTDPSAKNHGRYKNVGHVGIVFRDPETGRLMVSESAGGGKNSKRGVRYVTLEDWMNKQKQAHPVAYANGKGQFFAVDLLHNIDPKKANDIRLQAEKRSAEESARLARQSKYFSASGDAMFSAFTTQYTTIGWGTDALRDALSGQREMNKYNDIDALLSNPDNIDVSKFGISKDENLSAHQSGSWWSKQNFGKDIAEFLGKSDLNAYYELEKFMKAMDNFKDSGINARRPLTWFTERGQGSYIFQNLPANIQEAIKKNSKEAIPQLLAAMLSDSDPLKIGPDAQKKLKEAFEKAKKEKKGNYQESMLAHQGRTNKKLLESWNSFFKKFTEKDYLGSQQGMDDLRKLAMSPISGTSEGAAELISSMVINDALQKARTTVGLSNDTAFIDINNKADTDNVKKTVLANYKRAMSALGVEWTPELERELLADPANFERILRQNGVSSEWINHAKTMLKQTNAAKILDSLKKGDLSDLEKALNLENVRKDTADAAVGFIRSAAIDLQGYLGDDFKGFNITKETKADSVRAQLKEAHEKLGKALSSGTFSGDRKNAEYILDVFGKAVNSNTQSEMLGYLAYGDLYRNVNGTPANPLGFSGPNSEAQMFNSGTTATGLDPNNIFSDSVGKFALAVKEFTSVFSSSEIKNALNR